MRFPIHTILGSVLATVHRGEPLRLSLVVISRLSNCLNQQAAEKNENEVGGGDLFKSDLVVEVVSVSL